MTTPLPHGSIRSSLARRHAALRRALALRLSLRAAAACAAVITLAVLAGAAIAGAGMAWARLGLVAAACAACTAWAVRRFLREAPAFDAYLERVEQRFPDVRSWVRNAVDFASPRPTPGTSAELADAVTRETVRKLDGLPIESLAPRLAPARPAGAMALGLVVLIAAVWLAPQAIQRSWATLWNPAAATPPIAITVEPGSVKITPGASLAVYAHVTGTTHAPRLLRSGERPVDGVADGRTGDSRLWRFDLVQLTRAQDYRVRVLSAQSPAYHISLAGEPLPVSFEIEYRSPAYARLPVQKGSALRGDLSALRGTRAMVEVTFDRDLSRLEAAVPGTATAAWQPLTARRWRGTVTLDREGEYALHAVASAGEATYRYRLQPLADAPPVIAVRTPGGDVDLPAGQQVPLEVQGQDDLGLSELTLEYRKDAETAWRPLPLAQFGAHPREAEVRSRWDASSLGLLPGQTATFRFVLYDDNALGRGRAESPVFELKFPSLADLYQQINQTQGTVQKTLEKVADQAKDLQKSLDKLARQQPRAATETSPAFERSEELKSSFERQQDLAKQLDQAAQQLNESVSKAEERHAFDDELQRKLREMSELMQQIQSKDFKDALDRMQQAMEKLDKQALESQLPQWKQDNRDMLKNLERTMDLLKKLREEEKLDALAKRADELKAKQDELNQQHAAHEQQETSGKAPKSDAQSKTAEQQEQAAKNTEQLASDLKDLAKSQQSEAQQQQQMAQVSEQLQQQAANPQHDAAHSAQQKQSGNAKQSGQKASEGLKNASEALQQMAQQSQQQQQGADLAAVRRAAQDLVSLQRQSEGSLEPGHPNDERANQQTDLSEGVARVADSLGVLGQHTPFLSQKLTQSLGRAMNSLSQSGKDLGTGNRARGEQLGHDGSTALNESILELRASEASMCKQPGQGQGQQPGMSQRMSALGQQQSQLNERSKNLAQRLSQQLRISTGDQAELQRMAQEQSRLREQLGQIQKDDQARQKLLGRLDAAQKDMQDVEEALRQGNTGGDLEDKQTRILSRLLDANRSVNRRDFDPQRESRPGQELSVRSAAEIPADLLHETDHLRLDLLKADADRYPAQYRAFIEAYLKSLNGPRR